MSAQEQDGGFAVDDLAFHAGQGVQALAGESLGQQRQEVGNGCPAGELVIGRVQEPFDGLHPEGVLELGPQPGRRGLEGELLVDGQVVAQLVGDRGAGHDADSVLVAESLGRCWDVWWLNRFRKARET